MESRYLGSGDQNLPSSSHARRQSKQAAAATEHILVPGSCIDKEIRREVVAHQSVIPSSLLPNINALGEEHHQDTPDGILRGMDNDMIPVTTEKEEKGDGRLCQ